MTVNSNDLLDADLVVVMEMSFGATNWYNIRLALELHCTILDGIEVDSAVPDTCLLKMLVEWLRSGKNRTWRFNAQFIVLKLGRSKGQVDYILSSSLSRFHHSTRLEDKMQGKVLKMYRSLRMAKELRSWRL